MKDFLRFALVPLALLLASAAPPEQPIAMPNSGWTLVVPTGSPVNFRGFGEYGAVRYQGRFVLTGTFSYGCSIECEGTVPESQLVLIVYPDPAVAALMPRVKMQYGDLQSGSAIYIRQESRLAHAISTREERAALRAGRLPEVQGRIAIVVDDLEVSGECDSVTYSVRFVSLAKVQKFTNAEPAGGAGCG